ncbi:urea ABC transporter ATP-binding protein UrtD [Frankia sp. CNm7]|uniref:Urea ABC transporter ATP-binding protein UrtD n=1 Tax=Frankia nepalensis TaxID=1836974 RepID=A0A937RH03_9ACTN|nr:urea ABC transporter ATP-binding protein UrtD [Frankia nepalensis]MBL7496443.1 urea ABC transporter ATP-binding protein UrtD [Frankia nepalensis]MBL7512835.1 urea ABC transporter ATP-binding protein UrtD [Frankia nepalensis]MBL7522380.1 urea ABC transporter ATP-binding protein UrtD [Frankia nepalensis]MBL7630230.1 urea ABC transporter ATP-binding protein UrtD [Frankia nepalensis]
MTTEVDIPAPPPAGGSGEALLAVRGLRVVFDGFVAIGGIDFTVNRGELRFLIGPNGAGKTTLVDVITGLTKPAAGSVTFGGVELVGRREYRIVKLGIGRTFQTATVFEDLTVLENIDLAASFRMAVPKLFLRRRGVTDAVAQVLETTQLAELADRKAGVLSHGQRQWLEIGMLLAQDPQLLLLDEPVAGMTKDERERTGLLLQQIAAERTVVVIEHDMEFLRRFASVVTVLHEGKVLTEGTVAEVQADPRVQEVYLGRKKEDAAAGSAAVLGLEATP